MFSTPDHDVAAGRNGVSYYSGGWWYKDCTYIQLNGVFGDRGAHGIWIYTGVNGVNPSMRVMRN
jgi:hypothetical protein